MRVPDLLRKALVVARKLQLTDFEDWIARELDGYKLTRDVPPYRVIHGGIRAWNPYNRSWIPGVFEDPTEAERLSRRANGASVSELEETLEETKRRGGQLQMPFDQATQAALMRRFNVPLIPTLVISHTSLRHILDAVRTTVLNWALRLEADGIRGEGLTFTNQEREKVASPVYNTMNFYGGVSGSQIQQASVDSSQAMGIADSTLKELLSVVEEALARGGLARSGNDETGVEGGAADARCSSLLASPKAHYHSRISEVRADDSRRNDRQHPGS